MLPSNTVGTWYEFTICRPKIGLSGIVTLAEAGSMDWQVASVGLAQGSVLWSLEISQEPGEEDTTMPCITSR